MALILNSGVGDLRLDKVMAEGIVLELLAARNMLPRHPAIAFSRGVEGQKSLVVKIPRIGLRGYDRLASATEGNTLAETSLSDGSADVTIALRRKLYESGEIASSMLSDLLSSQKFLEDAMAAYEATLVEIMCDIGKTFAATVGTTGNDMDLTTHLAARSALSVANVPGPLLAVYHPLSWEELLAEFVSVGGSVQWDPNSNALLNKYAGGGGMVGRLFDVDCYTTTFVDEDGGNDKNGFMFGHGGIAMADVPFAGMTDSNEVVDLAEGRVRVGIQRDGRTGSWLIDTNAQFGFALGYDAAGRTIISDGA
jgi:hypothetical protein